MEALETTGAVGASGGAGHFFALAAQRSLASILPSALRYALTVSESVQKKKAASRCGGACAHPRPSPSQVLAQRQPSQWAWTLRAMPEINGLISLLVESHFLRRCGPCVLAERLLKLQRPALPSSLTRSPIHYSPSTDASFSEHFYGMRRASAAR